MKKYFRLVIFAIIIYLISVLTTAAMSSEVLAAEVSNTVSENMIYNGLKDFQILIDDSELDEDDIYIPSAAEEEMVTGGYIYTSDWQKYTNYYIYNQLSDTDKACWDAMSDLCIHYLEHDDAFTIKTSNTYIMKYLYYPEFKDTSITRIDLENSNLYRCVALFKLANPQYYFLQLGLSINSLQPEYFALLVYPDFREGEIRAEATKGFMDGVKKMIDVVSLEKADYDKVKKIHDLILDKMDYDYAYTLSSAEVMLRDTGFTQSAYSVFCTDKTVCAGYSSAFVMLCNFFDIPAINITSKTHAWNMVRLYDNWFELDLTYDDTTVQNSYIYSYFLKSDTYFDTMANHTVNTYYADLLPRCLSNTDSLNKIAAAPAEPAMTCQKPLITLSEAAGLVSMYSLTVDAAIYYTVDNIKPDIALTKLYKYTEPAAIYGDIQAIAVRDSYYTSEPSYLQHFYSVSYELYGGTNSGDNPLYYNQENIVLKDPVRPGYIFDGWYTSSDFRADSLITEIDASLKKSIRIFAKWVSVDNDENSDWCESVPVLNVVDYVYKVTDYTGNRTGIYYLAVGYYTGFDYSGQAIKPEVFIYNRNTKEFLKPGTQYSVRYANNKNASQNARIIIKGKGFYNFCKFNENFTIYPISFNHPLLSIEEYSLALKKNNKVQAKMPVIYFNKKKLKKSDYSIKYTGNVISPADGVSYIPYGSEGSYEVEIAEGKSHNIKGTKKTALTITTKNLASKFKVSYQKKHGYTGKEIKPLVNVTYKKLPLTEGRDYTVKYLSNINKGTAYIIVRGMGDYSGVVYKSFKIK